MRRPLLAALLATSSCVTADIGEDPIADEDEIELQAENGIFLSNGMNLGNG